MTDFFDTTVQIHSETDRAILVSEDGDEFEAVWLPLAEIEVNKRRGAIADVSIPDWLAADRGLV
ncbi:hypothetical protein LCM17_18460 [Cereibacter sphaeroides]|nr:hypothetical protein [Cereibacter sphaeroides]